MMTQEHSTVNLILILGSVCFQVSFEQARLARPPAAPDPVVYEAWPVRPRVAPDSIIYFVRNNFLFLMGDIVAPGQSWGGIMLACRSHASCFEMHLLEVHFECCSENFYHCY